MTAPWVLLAACPVLAPVPDAPGLAVAVRSPTQQAMALNKAGKAFYREGRFEQARAKYRAALAVDPEFLAPAFNVACSFALEDRYGEAAREAVALIHRAYVPWGRQVMEAADLAVLHQRPEMAALRAAMAQAAASWGESAKDGLLFIARTRPPVRVTGQGVLVLGLNQEIFAWLPHSGRYRQITFDDGRVLAFVRALDGRKVLYVRGDKLVQRPGTAPALRGLSLRLLELPSMSLGPTVPLPGDVARLEIAAAGAAAKLGVVFADGPAQSFVFDGGSLRPAVGAARGSHPIVLTGRGVKQAARVVGQESCSFRAEDERPQGEPARVRVRTGNRSRALAAPYGAGLHGLPF